MIAAESAKAPSVSQTNTDSQPLYDKMLSSASFIVFFSMLGAFGSDKTEVIKVSSLRESDASQPVVAVTGFGPPGDRRRTGEAGGLRSSSGQAV
jgi:hypothetical protein